MQLFKENNNLKEIINKLKIDNKIQELKDIIKLLEISLMNKNNEIQQLLIKK